MIRLDGVAAPVYTIQQSLLFVDLRDKERKVGVPCFSSFPLIDLTFSRLALISQLIKAQMPPKFSSWEAH